MQIVGWTSISLVTFTCGSWSDVQHDLYFMVQWFCLISWRLFDVWTTYFQIMGQYDLTFDLKRNVSHCDLHVYFIVCWGYTRDRRADKYPYPHNHCANKDSYPHDWNVTDDLCSLIKLCFAFIIIFRLNVFYCYSCWKLFTFKKYLNH